MSDATTTAEQVEALAEAQQQKAGTSYYFYRLTEFADSHRMIFSFMVIVTTLVVTDVIFNLWLFEPYKGLVEYLSGITPEGFPEVDIGFTPEVWQALLGLVLGTLILVISIASQSIPKLIDLYMKDLPSLLYIWLLILSGTHALLIKLYGEIALIRESSRIFNTHILLSVCGFIAFPYVFYILRYTKPTNIIERIYNNNLDRILSLTEPHQKALMGIDHIVERYQYEIFESLNQLDDILEYVNFKELKAEIIHYISQTVQEYLKVKHDFDPQFFRVSQKARSDISFKTMVGQFQDMETNQSFYEQKCFRLLGNIYIRLLEKGEFDLASLVAGEMANIGRLAIQLEQKTLVGSIIIRFNTLVRFAIKHGIRNNEPRNLYNLFFFYGNFISSLVDYRWSDQLKQSFFYLRIYGVEIFKHGSNAAAMYFIVDVIATEMKKILERIHNEQWDEELQAALLGELLQVDNPPDFNKEDLSRGILMNNGVRVLQFGMALFYLRENKESYVDRIIHDVLDDLKVLGEETFRKVVEMTSARLRFSGPTFWEDTDRGNLNIYYTPDQAHIDPLKERIYAGIQTRLIEQAQAQFKLDESEAKLVWELSRLLPEKEMALLLENPFKFEETLPQLEEVDSDRMNTLISVRKKLHFNSDNPGLTVTHTRQIAEGQILSIQAPSQNDSMKDWGTDVVVRFNSLNFFYVVPINEDSMKDLERLNRVVVTFQPMRRKLVYRFQASLEAHIDQLGKNTLRVRHTDLVKIIEER